MHIKLKAHHHRQATKFSSVSVRHHIWRFLGNLWGIDMKIQELHDISVLQTLTAALHENTRRVHPAWTGGADDTADWSLAGIVDIEHRNLAAVRLWAAARSLSARSAARCRTANHLTCGFAAVSLALLARHLQSNLHEKFRDTSGRFEVWNAND